MNLIPHPLMQRIAPRLAAKPHPQATASRWRQRVWNRIAHPVVLPWRDGLQVHAHPGDAAGEALFLAGGFEADETRWIASRLTAGDTFIDAGAGQGLLTLLASRRVGDAGRIVAIEPDNRRRYRLLDNVALNALTNVAVIPASVSGRPGPATTTIDRIAYEHDLTRVGVIGISVPRAAAQILRGAARTIDRCRPTFLVKTEEKPPKRSTTDEAQRFLQDRGYELHRFDGVSGKLLPVGQLGVGSLYLVALPAAAANRAAA